MQLHDYRILFANVLITALKNRVARVAKYFADELEENTVLENMFTCDAINDVFNDIMQESFICLSYSDQLDHDDCWRTFWRELHSTTSWWNYMFKHTEIHNTITDVQEAYELRNTALQQTAQEILAGTHDSELEDMRHTFEIRFLKDPKFISEPLIK